MSQYIGKTISLISNKGLRYVGLLDNINADDATVALKSVRLFGTEGRMAQAGTPQLEVLPGSDVYDYVVFRGSDVKDLSVLDTPIDQVKPDNYAPQPTSAYYGQQQPTQTSAPQPHTTQYQQPATTTTAPPATRTEPSSASPGQAAAVPAPTGYAQPTQQIQPEATRSSNAGPTPTRTQESAQPVDRPVAETTAPQRESQSGSPPAPQPQSHPQNHHERQRKQSRAPDIPDSEFDFESANAKFTKELESERELEHTTYNKSSSFFDNISSSNEVRGSMRWSEEKNLNMDTFGEASVRGRGRGRGRGGRGGWRGRGNGNGNWRGGRGGNRGGQRSSEYNSKPEWA
ncbi:multicopy suppressor of clathrin deficiency [Scheffersomyces xylosifermentans]|uniref:multicopy suppressor of clathrin deficiency n=1 Tax=Scheffersomyces xylosifermentans TaxID=1304137 RepID=UPI00315D8C87